MLIGHIRPFPEFVEIATESRNAKGRRAWVSQLATPVDWYMRRNMNAIPAAPDRKPVFRTGSVPDSRTPPSAAISDWMNAAPSLARAAYGALPVRSAKERRA